MKSIASSDISEESRYIADCPYCGEMTDIEDQYGDYDVCEHCGEGFEITED